MTVTSEASTEERLKECISLSGSRRDFWVEFIRRAEVACMVEVGVYQGDFAAFVLERCERVSRYYMLDPWRHIDEWHKPANEDDSTFEQFFQTAKTKTDFADNRRVILRGKTTEVANRIQENELDFAYIDGDHTLRGISIDLISCYSKVRTGGFIGGDDFSRTMWQHNSSFEPTLVYPFAVYFAEAVGATIYGLPYNQFCLQKTSNSHFSFVDLTGGYDELALRHQLVPGKLLKVRLRERFPALAKIAAQTRKLMP